MVKSAWSLLSIASACPFLKQMNNKELANFPNPHIQRQLAEVQYNVSAVKASIEAVMYGNDDATANADGGATYFTNAAGGHYGPNFIRLAWHCAGTWQTTPGHGGCDGARIRFPPESEWGDNAGLIASDNNGRGATLDVLESVKDEYGNALSWADLIALSGTVAIEHMSAGAVNPGFCGGRVDHSDGTLSMSLVLEMIYVNAGDTNAQEIREAFGRMGMNDRETMALTAGGHTFGRCHLGRGGFDGAWTHTPSSWSNGYVENLLGKSWVSETLANGNRQFRVENAASGDADLMMLVADESLLHDDAYRAILEDYRTNPSLLQSEFAAAWYKLMNGGMGDRCPEAPKSTDYTYDLAAVKHAIASVLVSDSADGSDTYFPNAAGGNYGPNFIRLAWHCAGTYVEDTNFGGCDGARIRFLPESEWGDNAGLLALDADGRGATLDVLLPVKQQFGEALSWADLITLSGDVAIEEMAGPQLDFCGGRPDEPDGARSYGLNASMIYVNAGDTDAAEIRTAFGNMGMNDRETIALIAGGHTYGRCHLGRSGFEGAWTHTPSTWSNGYVENLLSKTWVSEILTNGNRQFRVENAASGDADLMMLVADESLLHDVAYRAILVDYRANPESLKDDFGIAWHKLMNGGRIPECNARSNVGNPNSSGNSSPGGNSNSDGNSTSGGISNSSGYEELETNSFSHPSHAEISFALKILAATLTLTQVE